MNTEKISLLKNYLEHMKKLIRVIFTACGAVRSMELPKKKFLVASRIHVIVLRWDRPKVKKKSFIMRIYA